MVEFKAEVKASIVLENKAAPVAPQAAAAGSGTPNLLAGGEGDKVEISTSFAASEAGAPAGGVVAAGAEGSSGGQAPQQTVDTSKSPPKIDGVKYNDGVVDIRFKDNWTQTGEKFIDRNESNNALRDADHEHGDGNGEVSYSELSDYHDTLAAQQQRSKEEELRLAAAKALLADFVDVAKQDEDRRVTDTYFSEEGPHPTADAETISYDKDTYSGIADFLGFTPVPSEASDWGQIPKAGILES